ncbi:hypothetical protein GQ473_00565 [archaeon]|nr:hypothetical protein [archaeon]
MFLPSGWLSTPSICDNIHWSSEPFTVMKSSFSTSLYALKLNVFVPVFPYTSPIRIKSPSIIAILI